MHHSGNTTTDCGSAGWFYTDQTCVRVNES